MKRKKVSLIGKKNRHVCCLLLACLLIGLNVFAQNTKVIKGTIVDDRNEPSIGASILEKGTSNGTITGLDGDFSLTVADNAVLVISYIGYKTQEITVANAATFNIILKEDTEILEEVVVIGYGTAKKNDLTGSITAIGEKDFQKGIVTTPTSLITGKVAGVQITSNGGRAGEGNRIRIRGGASLNASNDPLIVVDGVPLDNDKIAGMTNPLAMINPNDIESMNILKDASAAAIYGSRASNGVIIITTKKGSTGSGKKGVNIDVSSQNSIATIARKVNTLSAKEFRELVANNPFAEERYTSLLGNANTNWQDEIFRSAITTDNNISISGAVKNLPYRVSAGFISQDGILETDNVKRTTANLNLSPSFFDKHLNVNINLKGTYAHSRFGNGDAIGEALRMDPTQPVKASGFDKFNGYWAWLDPNDQSFMTLATKNPVAVLQGRNDNSEVYRSIGNAQVDYKMHFLPDLRANLNVGYDISQGKGDNVVKDWSPAEYTKNGKHSNYKQNKRNLLLEFYLNYTKEFNAQNKLEVMAGYTYQDWKMTDHNYPTYDYSGQTVLDEGSSFPKTVNQNTLVSFYGRLNYNLMDKYLLTATVRRDGSSRFGKDNRWGTFPSVALAWRINQENFLKDVEALSNLKLRLGYGITGQQDGIGNYDHIARYSMSDPTARVQFGDEFYYLWRPEGYDSGHKWEQTATTNVGLDWGVTNNRIYGSIDYYYKHTSDLLNEVPLPMGSNFTNRIVKNIGSLNNKGIEASIGVVAIDNNDMHWDAGFNVTYNKTKITKLSLNDGPDSDYAGVQVGDISGGTSNTIQIHSVDYAPFAFYVYKQLYDVEGKPVPGAYADLNGDGKINSDDLYRYKKAEPDVFMGFNTNFVYKNWSLATALRASFGNYIYNNVYSDAGNYSQVLNPNNFLMNTVKDIYNTRFYDRQLLSDYYIQNASFLKMDYLQVGYDFGKIAKLATLRLNFTVQNVLTITNYDGIDPEIAGGIDRNFYPSPKTFNVGLSLNF